MEGECHHHPLHCCGFHEVGVVGPRGVHVDKGDAGPAPGLLLGHLLILGARGGAKS